MLTEIISNGTKALISLSGGLDSILAAKIMLEQGIALEAVNFQTIFCTCTAKNACCTAARSAADQLNIPLKIFNVSEEYLEIIKHPRHGYGRNLNPCLDCRIFMLKKAVQYMRAQGISFIVTGEVLGERPMSQRREAMRLIERGSGLAGMILRPLSAKLLEPTIPEKQGLVDREKLLAISGRSRKPQMALAQHYQINDYPCPAGGCLLTDPGFARRLRDLMKHKPDFDLNDAKLLKVGRHLRISEQAKLIIGRNQEDNLRLAALAHANDILIDAQAIPGPIALIRGPVQESEIEYAAAIIAGYSKAKNLPKVKLTLRIGPSGNPKPIEAVPVSMNRVELVKM
jgi:tRNA U34 2-thiouridine synthase MnmA/TrmU